MKKDIPFLPVKGVHVAIIRKRNEINQDEWYVYVINHNPFHIHDMLVVSKGYGHVDNEKVLTSTLRHMIEEIPPEGHALVEPIDPSVFHLVNEYWVSYYIDGQIYDKKFIFLPETIIEENLIEIPIMEAEGILHE